MADLYANQAPSLDSPAMTAAAVTPNDSNDLAVTARALYVGGAGDLSLVLVGDTAAVTFAAVPAGSVLPLRVKRVRATGTTATAIVALA